jgi:hypothetical protein
MDAWDVLSALLTGLPCPVSIAYWLALPCQHCLLLGIWLRTCWLLLVLVESASNRSCRLVGMQQSLMLLPKSSAFHFLAQMWPWRRGAVLPLTMVTWHCCEVLDLCMILTWMNSIHTQVSTLAHVFKIKMLWLRCQKLLANANCRWKKLGETWSRYRLKGGVGE